MSVNRENVIWQSPDGSWNRGFYEHWNVGDQDDPEWDYEWDVEYGDQFEWVRTGLSSEEDAVRSWGGANPGGRTTWTYSPQSAEVIEELDDKAAIAYEKFGSERYDGHVYMPDHYKNYLGPAKKRVPQVQRGEVESRARDAQRSLDDFEKRENDRSRYSSYGSYGSYRDYETGATNRADALRLRKEKVEEARKELDDFDRANPQAARIVLQRRADEADARVKAIDEDAESNDYVRRYTDDKGYAVEALNKKDRDRYAADGQAARDRLAWVEQQADPKAQDVPAPAKKAPAVPKPAKATEASPPAAKKKATAPRRRAAPVKPAATNPNRQPKGSSKGGQFAPKMTPEADVKLDWNP